MSDAVLLRPSNRDGLQFGTRQKPAAFLRANEIAEIGGWKPPLLVHTASGRVAKLTALAALAAADSPFLANPEAG